jgi:hypothetical protein
MARNPSNQDDRIREIMARTKRSNERGKERCEGDDGSAVEGATAVSGKTRPRVPPKKSRSHTSAEVGHTDRNDSTSTVPTTPATNTSTIENENDSVTVPTAPATSTSQKFLIDFTVPPPQQLAAEINKIHPLPSLTCDTCRKHRKKACTKEVPACGFCLNNGMECRYSGGSVEDEMIIYYYKQAGIMLSRPSVLTKADMYHLLSVFGAGPQLPLLPFRQVAQVYEEVVRTSPQGSATGGILEKVGSVVQRLRQEAAALPPSTGTGVSVPPQKAGHKTYERIQMFADPEESTSGSALQKSRAREDEALVARPKAGLSRDTVLSSKSSNSAMDYPAFTPFKQTEAAAQYLKPAPNLLTLASVPQPLRTGRSTPSHPGRQKSLLLSSSPPFDITGLDHAAALDALTPPKAQTGEERWAANLETRTRISDVRSGK